MKTRHPLSLSQGFTLLEIMVVLVIMGILVGFATLGLNKSPSDQLHEEARRVEARILLAQENAVLEGRDLGLGVFRTGYRFFELLDEEWTPIDADPQLKASELPEDIEAQLTLESVAIVMESKEPEKPQVFILSSGESTPFSLEFTLDDLDPVGVRFDMLGRVVKDTPL